MRDINTVTLTGRTTRDAELKYANGGLAICEVSLAVNRSVKRGDKYEDEPSFFDVVIFGRMAEVLQKMLTKGTACTIEGELKQDRWKNTEGQNRSKVVIIADNVKLHGSGKPSERDDGASRAFDDDLPDWAK